MEEPVRYPVDGILDLHMFRPQDARSVITEYLGECQARNILRVRIIHGKGRSVLRGLVRRLLDDHPAVIEHHVATDRSGWGAIIAHLSPRKPF